MAFASKDLKSLLKGCLSNINHQSSLMKQCLSENNLLQALKHSSNFLNELRTNQLSPKEYYELYIAIFDSLEALSTYLVNIHNSKQKKKHTQIPFLADLYELVQYSGNIIPRLYMMIVIGTTYMSTKDAPKKEIMKDLIEMCRGVQHPIRGLFLRYYLSQRIKDLLPLSNENDFKETVDFLISNFIEMNKLWVRLQHQGHSSEREIRYQERKELKILVGSNLVRLSQIIDDYSGDDNYSAVNFYKENIFPTISEQIIQCKDHLAQSYLIDVLIQIFPDDFHFSTLDELLNNLFLNLHPMLKKSEIISTLIERFITYHKFESDLEDDLSKLSLKEKKLSPSDLFDTFWNVYLKIYKTEEDMPAEEHSIMLQSIIALSLTYDPENYNNLDIIYKFATENLTNDKEQDQLWSNLLIAPIKHFTSIKKLLDLPFFHEFYLKLSDAEYQKNISLEIINKFTENTEDDVEMFSTTEDIDKVFKYLAVLIKDSNKNMDTAKNLGITKSIQVNGDGYITQEFLNIQENICKLIHLITNKNPFVNLTNLMYVRKKYLNKSLENIIYTYPTLISKILNNIRIAGYLNLKTKSTNRDLLLTTHFKNLSVIIDELYQHHQQFYSELILKFYLNAASVADQLKQETISYELFTQCFIVYEENLIFSSTKNYTNVHDITGGSASYQAIVAIANRLTSLRYFNKENYENLITKVTLYGSKLLKKQDQCRSVYFCAHLWWWCDLYIKDSSPTVENPEETLYRDSKRVLECLQKALRVADSCMDPFLSIKLFIEILSRYLIFNIYDNHLIDARYINGLIHLIRTNLANLKDDNSGIDGDNDEAHLIKQISDLFERVLSYIRDQQLEERFIGVSV